MHSFEDVSIKPNQVGIHWFGQSSYALKTPEGTIIQVDPYFPRERSADRFIHAESPLDESQLKTDVVLLTHDHGDHTCVESLERILKAFPNVQFVAPRESIKRLRDIGVPDALLNEIKAKEAIAVGDVSVLAVWAKLPDGIPDDNIAPPDVDHLGYVVEIGGVRVYISGDPVNTFANHEALWQPVADLKPDIGFLTTHPDEGEFPFFAGSVDMAKKIGLKHAVPAHYQCFVKRNYNPDEWAAGFGKNDPTPLIIRYNTHIVYAPQG